MEEVRINTGNIALIGLAILVCVYVGGMSAAPHQSELIAGAINAPAQFTDALAIPQVSDEDIAEMMEKESVVAAMDLPGLTTVIIIGGIVMIGMFMIMFMFSGIRCMAMEG